MKIREIVDVTGNWSLAEARDFCLRLARDHYENFVVASLFVPRRMRCHFTNLYAYCRISDDLGDEIPDRDEALRLLDWWDGQLADCFNGRPEHPVFVALRETIEEFSLPKAPFADLIHAFRQDQTKMRYETYDELLEYCRYSANPVGRLVLYLFGHRDEERQRLSDCTCTALQLANHWQDIAQDLLQRNRIYLPAEDMRRFQYGEDDLRREVCDRRFAGLMAFEVERARALFHQGLALSALVRGRLAVEVGMFGHSGLKLLGKIESAGYDVFHRRPTLSKWDHIRILLGCWLRAGSE
jgi:squalene synthase HpnC